MKDKSDNCSMISLEMATEELIPVAMELVENEGNLHIILDKAHAICEWLKGVPVLGEVFEDVFTIMDMIQSYIHKEYTQIPLASLLSCLAALIYLVCPIDVISDCMPFIGYVDDISVIKRVLQSVQTDLNQYKQWKSMKENQRIMRYHEKR